MRRLSGLVSAGALCCTAISCAEPTGLHTASGSPTNALSESLSPNRSQQIMLHGSGWGRAQFRQPEDGTARIIFVTWLRDLRPFTTYLLQQALDPVVDGVCTGGTTDPAEWVTVGAGTKPFTIMTDERGSFHAPLYRDLPRRLVGTAFDIHLRIVEKATGAVVQESDCFHFEVNL